MGGSQGIGPADFIRTLIRETVLMPIQPVSKIWMDGEFVDWDKAQIHVLTHTLHYGNGVFEGIRCYETPRGPAVFRLTQHIQRLFNSAKILLIDIPFTAEQMVAAVAPHETKNHDHAYTRSFREQSSHD